MFLFLLLLLFLVISGSESLLSDGTSKDEAAEAEVVTWLTTEVGPRSRSHPPEGTR